MIAQTSSLLEVSGTALLHGPAMMREPHWKWTRSPDRAYLLKVSGEDAAILRLFVRILKKPNRTLRAVGIGGVWTRPDLRNQGYATKLLYESVLKIREQQPSADVLILHSAMRRLYYPLGPIEIVTEIAEGLLAASLHGDTVILPGNWHVEPEGHF